MSVIRWIKLHLDIVSLALIVGFICFKNFTPQTFLVGWDNLMPELNMGLNIKRSFLAVWQEYQGLGLVGGMGHATDLIRQLILLPFSLILPTNLIRYLWQFAMLFLGTFGIYFGLKNYLKFPRFISFSAALFYLLNFGSVQLFWVPFEPFSTFWGFFPWLVFSLFEYLKKPSKLSTFKLVTFNLLAIPAFYVQTIFIVYLICLFIILFSNLVFSFKNFKFQIKNFAKILFLIFAINSFWLLPFVYFLKNNSQNPLLAIGNTMATQETVDRNLRRGYFSDFAILRGYYYDFPDSSGSLMYSWVNHFANHYLLLCGYLLSFFTFLGLLYLLSRFKKLSPFRLSILLIFFLSAIALLSATPPFQQINLLIRHLSFIDQVFRSPWTKFIVPSIFCFTILSAYGLKAIADFLIQIKYSKTVLFLFHTSYILLLLVFSLPVFSGNYFSPRMRQTIPSEYFDLIKFFKTKPFSARIMNLPQGSFWGWTNYRWGTSGSGFLWYGIPQPILDRAFDVWEIKNQQYYFELTLALQQQNSVAFHQILDKYSIEYVIFDNNVFFPDEKIYSKVAIPTRDLINNLPGLTLVQKFGSIGVYHYNHPSQPYFTTTPNDTPSLISTSTSIIPDQKLLGSTVILPQSHNPLTYPQSQYIDSKEKFFRLESNLSNQLLAFSFPKVTFNQTHLLYLRSRNISGHPLTLSAFDEAGAHYRFFYAKLSPDKKWTESWYLIPKMESYPFTSGLTILFNNPSFDYFPSVNDVTDVKLYPYNLSTNLDAIYTHPIRTYSQSKSNLFFYQITPAATQKYLVLPQSYSDGWLAFSSSHLLPNHILVNNWANGWSIPNNLQQPIYIVFWPQILEFLGFTLLLGTIIYTICRK